MIALNVFISLVILSLIILFLYHATKSSDRCSACGHKLAMSMNTKRSYCENKECELYDLTV